ncbi:hypothetical protein V1478_001403 [Vespula squamosa]|uniref:Uncharacterized protein n=1 Tax=Vespula squamosa TaxID=30214 RepID=A0ABD2C1D1_VESSQ
MDRDTHRCSTQRHSSSCDTSGRFARSTSLNFPGDRCPCAALHVSVKYRKGCSRGCCRCSSRFRGHRAHFSASKSASSTFEKRHAGKLVLREFSACPFLLSAPSLPLPPLYEERNKRKEVATRRFNDVRACTCNALFIRPMNMHCFGGSSEVSSADPSLSLPHQSHTVPLASATTGIVQPHTSPLGPPFQSSCSEGFQRRPRSHSPPMNKYVINVELSSIFYLEEKFGKILLEYIELCNERIDR